MLKTQILEGVPGLDLDPSSGSGVTLVWLSFRTLNLLGVRMQYPRTGAPTWLKNCKNQQNHDMHELCELNPCGAGKLQPVDQIQPNKAHKLRRLFTFFKWLGKNQNKNIL